jgi:hypothetical protein
MAPGVFGTIESFLHSSNRPLNQSENRPLVRRRDHPVAGFFNFSSQSLNQESLNHSISLLPMEHVPAGQPRHLPSARSM